MPDPVAIDWQHASDPTPMGFVTVPLTGFSSDPEWQLLFTETLAWRAAEAAAPPRWKHAVNAGDKLVIQGVGPDTDAHEVRAYFDDVVADARDELDRRRNEGAAVTGARVHERSQTLRRLGQILRAG